MNLCVTSSPDIEGVLFPPTMTNCCALVISHSVLKHSASGEKRQMTLLSLLKKTKQKRGGRTRCKTEREAVLLSPFLNLVGPSHKIQPFCHMVISGFLNGTDKQRKQCLWEETIRCMMMFQSNLNNSAIQVEEMSLLYQYTCYL